MVDAAADSNGLPATFLTWVLWQESGFRTDVTSPAGAAGVAQFMPQTSAVHGLADPYDPGPAILQAARLLAELGRRFGNFGLAAAAYNAGAGRLSKWLHAQSGLPPETRLYVLAVTGHRVEEWRTASGSGPSTADRGDCLAATTDLARPTDGFSSAPAVSARMAAWQVRLDEFLAKAVRLQQQRAPVRSRFRAGVERQRPCVIGYARWVCRAPSTDASLQRPGRAGARGQKAEKLWAVASLHLAHHGKQRQEGRSMRLDLEFHEASSVTNVTAYVVVNDFDPSPDGLPCLAEDCVSMAELAGY
jgi:hypothetical protein